MSLVTWATERGVRTLTLNDEARRNALSHDLVAELVALCDEADEDPTVRVIVITNAGTTFCAGANLSERAGGSPVGAIDPTTLFGRFARSPKPYVGRIAGHCVAGGMGLAAALDITVARQSARFGFTEVRVGVAPAMISVVCLPKMRRSDAAAAFLRGHRFSASDAAAMGLITYAVPDDDLDATVDAVVADVLAGGPHALAAAKELLARVPAMGTVDAFSWTMDLSGRLFTSEEAREGMSAFLEKRPASWVPTEDS
jgi:methylglutaconyl-CoA hydratase